VLGHCIFFKEVVILHVGASDSIHSKSGSCKVCAKSIGPHGMPWQMGFHRKQLKAKHWLTFLLLILFQIILL
jgi:hypothetical protein